MRVCTKRFPILWACFLCFLHTDCIRDGPRSSAFRRWRSNNFVLSSSRTRLRPFYHDVYVHVCTCISVCPWAPVRGKERKKKKIWFIMRHLCIVIRLRVGYLAFDEWESGKGFFYIFLPSVYPARVYIYTYISSVLMIWNHKKNTNDYTFAYTGRKWRVMCVCGGLPGKHLCLWAAPCTEKIDTRVAANVELPGRDGRAPPTCCWNRRARGGRPGKSRNLREIVAKRTADDDDKPAESGGWPFGAELKSNLIVKKKKNER